ncbi:MAG: AAA family ATPase, partial [Actinomycetota bacterium]
QDPGRHLLTESVGDEIALALRSMGIPEGEHASRVADVAVALELDAMRDRHPLDRTVGERERVALAAILVANPGVLVLDEPTRGMDPLRKRALAQIIRARAAAGAAVLVATHDGPFAVAAADEVLEMVHGDAVPTGLPPTALLAA